MYKIILLVVVIIIIIIISALVIYNLSQTTKLAYANINDPYDKPFVLENVLTPEQCREIINHATAKLFESEVVGGKDKNVRNSMQCWIPKSDPVVKHIFDKMSQRFNIPFENAEELQVVRYLPDQYYNEHHDACCDDNAECKEFIKRGGQRKLTVLIYLNDNFEEGNTYFKNLDLKMKAKPGDAIAFFPLAKNSNYCHPLALHAGMPVKSGEKWVCNVWFRENKFI
ncbi:prolyl 4-hydroxylase alpha subunit [Klosneuvirus KNV1]|uniref:Prolyl 4-hydroxylase alpha subunit n=1 Tax=Klosneuvirus KNV1 TaxID=1977640 RepID=A0A1V0SIE1_9VIRU|nr:prolyl 4-hydroxylase alpha subunit [Klosneuvirus KNV1]